MRRRSRAVALLWWARFGISAFSSIGRSVGPGNPDTMWGSRRSFGDVSGQVKSKVGLGAFGHSTREREGVRGMSGSVPPIFPRRILA
ncbi:hypothetical protein HPP92_019086 [Vanilla planifolia]|uniref:Secreted protein n=1 Tax=Vanilla planifolia TaxID=51239 RepID=A0A835QBU0_VANPL|nr:hypothetical protein HPP92_026848 [Vanilla planifolia]KAG0464922.1 hypothetical protein HPP92_019086 [Vanilla planifolia]